MSQGNSSTRNLEFNYFDYQNRNKNLQKSKIDKYYIFQKLGGTGQFGTVYRGMDGVSKNEVAIKILDKRAVEQEKNSNTRRLKKRLIQDESQIMKQVNSSNVLKCYECLQNRDLKIMILQYCNNGSLFDLLSDRGRLPEDEAVTLFKQVINGVAQCHKQKIIHRDLKLQNILIHNGQCKIADFGFSKVLKINTQYEATKLSTLGSLLTMAPQVMLRKKYGLKADIWSLGVIFFQLIFGRNPFKFDGTNVEKCFRDGINLINNQEQYYEVKPSAEVKKFLREVLVYDQQKRLGWKEILNHQLFKVEKPTLPTRFYPRVELRKQDSQLQIMERQFTKNNNSSLQNSGILSQQIPIQSLQKSTSQHQLNQHHTQNIIQNSSDQSNQIKPQSQQQKQQSSSLNIPEKDKIQENNINIKEQSNLKNIKSKSTQIKPSNQKSSQINQQQRQKQNDSLPVSPQFKTSISHNPTKFQQQNKIAQNLLKSSQILNQNPLEVNNKIVEEIKKQTQIQIQKKPQVKKEENQQIKQKNEVIRDEVRQQHKQQKLDKYSLSDKEIDRAHNEINREEEQIYKWAQRIHNQCLRAEFIYNNIVKVIEKHNLLDLNERDSIELMYLICTRCRNNISPIYNEYAKRKNNRIIQDLKNLVEPLYRIITGKWNTYSNQLTRKQNQKIVMFKDFFSKRISADFKRKDFFLTAVESMEEFKPSNVRQNKQVKPKDKSLKKQETFYDYTKQEQILFTNECMEKAIPKLRFVGSNNELRMTMKNFKKICLLGYQNLKPEQFRSKLKQVCRAQ